MVGMLVDGHKLPGAPATLPEAEVETAGAALRMRGLGLLLERLLHDLKQPLNQVRVVAQDVRIDVRKDRLEVASLAGGMREIESAVDELVARLDQLRAFVAPPPEPDLRQPFELSEICRTVLARMGGPNSALVVEENYEPGLMVNLPERGSLEQVLTELLQNSQQAAARAGRTRVAVAIVTERRDEDACLIVRDDAGGVTEHRDKIFEPFFSTRSDATGLGLPLARALVERLGGHLTLNKSDDWGAEFQVVIFGRE